MDGWQWKGGLEGDRVRSIGGMIEREWVWKGVHLSKKRWGVPFSIFQPWLLQTNAGVRPSLTSTWLLLPSTFPASVQDIRARDFNWKYLIPNIVKLAVLAVVAAMWIYSIDKHCNDEPTGWKPNVTVSTDGAAQYSWVSDAVATAPAQFQQHQPPLPYPRQGRRVS
ncbi:hypothetical protein ACLOJK_026264 [Asimina triloba]